MNVLEPQNQRIVITGLGVVSPLGRTVESFWRSLSAPAGNEAGAGSEDAEATGVADFSGRIQDFGELPDDVRKRIRKSLKVMNRETQLGVAAGQQALQSSLLCGAIEPDRIGVCFGADNASVMPSDFEAGIRVCSSEDRQFDFRQWGTNGIAEVEPLWMLKCLPNMSACHLAIINDLRGPNNTATQRDLAFGMAVAQACRDIRGGACDAMLVGATGTTRSAFNRMHAQLEQEVSGQDDRDARPAPAEGAGAIVLESLQSARERGATIHGEILGTASTARVGHDGAAACGRALTGAIRQALRRAGLSASSVGHIHSCGLDADAEPSVEAQAIADVFGTDRPGIPVVAAKRRLGHAGAGAAALEMIGSLLAIHNDRLFPSPGDRSAVPHEAVDARIGEGPAAGGSFLCLSLFRRGLAHCMAVGAYRS